MKKSLYSNETIELIRKVIIKENKRYLNLQSILKENSRISKKYINISIEINNLLKNISELLLDYYKTYDILIIDLGQRYKLPIVFKVYNLHNYLN